MVTECKATAFDRDPMPRRSVGERNRSLKPGASGQASGLSHLKRGIMVGPQPVSTG